MAGTDPDDGIEAEEVLFTNDERNRIFLAGWASGEKSIARRELIVQYCEDLRAGAYALQGVLSGELVIDVEVNESGEDEVVLFEAHESWAAELPERAARKAGEL